MNYKETIQRNCNECSPVSWWPQFAFHYTDLSNAVSILSSGFLYSRIKAERFGVMRNDNASRQVIDMTGDRVKASVRFYFRPRTPTQYYNEGFKHPSLRYQGDEYANVPVPVFFLFDLEKLLSDPYVRFSETTQAGYSGDLLSGAEAFSQLDFRKIYSTGSEHISELVQYRHAELLYPNQMPIDGCLRYILCRNSVEWASLINLLKKYAANKLRKYQNRIRIAKRDTFENNGLYLSDCKYHDGKLTISFSDNVAKRDYTSRMKLKNNVDTLSPVRFATIWDWMDGRNNLYHTETESEISYEGSQSICYRLPIIDGAKTLRVQPLLELKQMGNLEFPLNSSEVIN